MVNNEQQNHRDFFVPMPYESIQMFHRHLDLGFLEHARHATEEGLGFNEAQKVLNEESIYQVINKNFKTR